MLKRRQIHSSRNVAQAVARLLLRFISQIKHSKLSESQLIINDVKELGRQLVAAQPREIVIGNIVRRVLGVIREEADVPEIQSFADLTLSGRASRSSSVGDESAAYDSGANSGTATPASNRPWSSRGDDDIDDISRRKFSKVYIPSLNRGLSRTNTIPQIQGTYPNNLQHTMFNLLSVDSPASHSPLALTPNLRPEGGQEIFEDKDLRGDIIEGIREIIDELGQVDDQIGQHSESYIHANEIIMVHGSSITVQRFLLKAALKRKFTVIVVEAFPNEYIATHSLYSVPPVKKPAAPPSKPGKSPTTPTHQDDPMSNADFKASLMGLGVDVMIIPDSAVFAIMSRVNKVILGTHVVMANGSLVAAGGARLIAKCAQQHSTRVVVVTGVYKLSPIYPFDVESMLEIGDSSATVGWQEGVLVKGAEVINPIMDFVPESLVDLYITNV